MTRSAVSPALRRELATEAGTRWGYCLSDEALSGAPLSVDHIVPVAAGGLTIRENLWLVCRSYKEFKGARTHADDPVTGKSAPVFNPRTQVWTEHFRWSEDGTLVIDY